MDEGRPPRSSHRRRAGSSRRRPRPTTDPVDRTEAARPSRRTDVPFEPRGPSRALVAIVLVLVAALVVFAFVGGRIVSNATPAGATGSSASRSPTAAESCTRWTPTADPYPTRPARTSSSASRAGRPTAADRGHRRGRRRHPAVRVRRVRRGRRRAPDRLRRARAPAVLHVLVARRAADRVPHDRARRDRPAPRARRRQRRARIVREGLRCTGTGWATITSWRTSAASGVGSFLGEVDLQGTSTERVPLDAGSSGRRRSVGTARLPSVRDEGRTRRES